MIGQYVRVTLQGVLEKLPTRELVIKMEDYNAKVGRDNTGRDHG